MTNPMESWISVRWDVWAVRKDFFLGSVSGVFAGQTRGDLDQTNTTKSASSLTSQTLNSWFKVMFWLPESTVRKT